MKALAALSSSARYPDLEAKTRELLRNYPENGLLWKILGVALWMQGKDALVSMQRAAELLPNDAEAWGNLGNILRGRGQLESAMLSHRRALELNPDYAECHNNLGGVLQDLGRLDDAAESFRRAALLKPDFALAHGNLGNVLSLLDRLEESEVSCRRALELNPNLTAATVQLAEAHAGRGEFDTAEKLLRQAIAIEPEMPEAWAGLVRWRRMGAEDAEWLAAAQQIVSRPLAPRREVPLRYALGKYFDDLAEYAAAFFNYQRANELSKIDRRAHDQGQLNQGIARITEVFNGEWLIGAAEAANASDLAVYVVGMPRSGTTLVEQILASHTAVSGAGELPFWNEAATTYAATRGGAADISTLRQFAEQYLGVLRGVSAQALRVVDKMPGNFLYLGLIHATLPNAKIIHMRRHPIDTCLSIYFQNFAAKHAYANDMEDLAHYYGKYLSVMDHWRQLLPAGSILDVPYEALVEDVEGWSRRMVEFIGLPWDSNCLEFHRNERTVNTASKWQARQKVHGSSVGRWRHYEKFVGPLRVLTEEQNERPHNPVISEAVENSSHRRS